MRRTSKGHLLNAIIILNCIAFTCSCAKSGLPSRTVNTNSPQSAEVPSEIASVSPENTREATRESSSTPTAELQPTALPALADMGRIVFSSSRDDNDSDVFIMNADGSGVRFLAGTSGSGDTRPAWSPDGEWIAFISSAGGTLDIQRIRPDGSGLENLTDDPADDENFDWSPDGSQIVFESNRSGNHELYLMNADGSHARRLTWTSGRWEMNPAWSPLGDAIAYRCRPEDSYTEDLCIMNADGSGQTNLTEGAGNVWEFVWSPDGSRLAFGRSTRPAEIWLMNPDGSGKQNLTNDPADDSGFAFSPDGARIAFSSDRAGKNTQIFLMNSDGSDVVQLTDNDLYNSQPVWSPDGTAIAFLQTAYPGKTDYEISVIRIDGSGPINLTSNPARDLNPDWEPL